MTIPENLKAARAALGLTQTEMAAQSGVSARGYQGYEDGRSVPGGEVITNLVRLGINANWLLTGEGPMLLSDLMERPGSPVRAEIEKMKSEKRDLAEFMRLKVQQVSGAFYAQPAPPKVPKINAEALGAMLEAACMAHPNVSRSRQAALAAEFYAISVESETVAGDGIHPPAQDKAI